MIKNHINTYSPDISRIEKVYDIHKRISSVEYFYVLGSKQQIFLSDVIRIWTTNPKYNQYGAPNLPDNADELLQKMRLVMRTKEYSENIQSDLIRIRDWYLIYKQQNKIINK